MQRRPRVAVLIVLACAAGATGVSVSTAASVSGSDDAVVQAGNDPGCLPPENEQADRTRRYIEWVASASPEELAATFGRGER
jgi:hypothetical protein